MKANAPTFQELILKLESFWAERGCVLQQPYDVEVGAGTMSPETFLRVLGPKPYGTAYLQPSRRPADGRYGDNPNRLFKHTQLQVILKPPPEDVQELYLESLRAVGIDLRQHDIKFEEDNWESPTLGAWGIGWQVMLDGLEVTQFTYFQQCGGVDLDPISAELTYGLERLAAFLQDVDSIYEIVWARDPHDPNRVTTYGDVRHAEELQFSVYNFEMADVEKTWEHLRLYEAECKALIEINVELQWRGAEYLQVLVHPFRYVADRAPRLTSEFTKLLGPATKNRATRVRLEFDVMGNGAVTSAEIGKPGDYVFLNIGGATTQIVGVAEPIHAIATVPNPYSVLLPAFDLCLKCSHLFNLLDARGAISVTERVGLIARIRALAVGVARAYVAQRGWGAEASKEEKKKEKGSAG